MTPAWRVRRTGGLLVPGFTKRFDERGRDGMTYFLGVPIGRFDVDVLAGGATELRYRRWPVVDVLERLPAGASVAAHGGAPPTAAPIPAAGFVRLPGGRRVRFCRFRLEP